MMKWALFLFSAECLPKAGSYKEETNTLPVEGTCDTSYDEVVTVARVALSLAPRRSKCKSSEKCLNAGSLLHLLGYPLLVS